ncbi:MAG TPA: Cys-tRNA(Pro) deacylase [Acidimicrobiales bacterium]|nr:Cys-tRNA(Pro) deacylase [Acidimicrobiales bacterium]
MSGKGTPAVTAARRAGVGVTIHELVASPADGRGYGVAAAEALGVPPERVFKTLVVAPDGGLAIAIVPVDHDCDLKAVAGALGAKRAVMADQRDAERATGYVVGGISPLGQRRRLPTVVDASAADHVTVFVSGGRRGLELELAPADLIALTGAVVAPIAG